MLIKVTQAVLGTLNVFVCAQSQSKPIGALKEVVTLVELTLRILRQLVVQVGPIDHCRAEA